MSILSVLPRDLVLPTTIIETLKGKASVYVENPWFFNGLTKTQQKADLCTVKLMKGPDGKPKKSTFGSQFVTPRLMLRRGVSGSFTPNFNIKYSEEERKMKNLRVKKPYLPDGVQDPSKYKVELMLMPSAVDRTKGSYGPEDEIMLKLDQIYIMTMEFIFIAINSKFNVTDEYHDDKVLITALFTHLGQNDAINRLNPKYFSYMSNPPVWVKADDGTGIFSIDEDEGENTLFDLCRSCIPQPEDVKGKKKGASKRQLSEFEQQFISDFASEISKANCSFVPAFRKIRYFIPDEKKKNATDPDDAVAMEINLKFHLQTEKTPEKFPVSLLTKTPTRSHRTHVMDVAELQRLYGVGDIAYSKAKWCTAYDCHIFVGPTTEFAVYKSGQTKVGWYVDTLMYKRIQTTASNNTFLNETYFDDVDDQQSQMNTDELSSQMELLQQMQDDDEA